MTFRKTGEVTRLGEVKVAKLGDASTGHIPSADDQAKILKLLKDAEAQPDGWLMNHFDITVTPRSK